MYKYSKNMAIFEIFRQSTGHFIEHKPLISEVNNNTYIYDKIT